MANTYSAGIATAYGAAVRGGYTGTYDDFCRQQAEYAESAAAVEQAKADAETAADAAEASKTAAAGSASAAATSAGQASTSATNAANSATAANASKNAAATSATEAGNFATAAAGSAATAQGVLESIPPSYDDLADEVADLKEDFTLLIDDNDLIAPVDQSALSVVHGYITRADKKFYSDNRYSAVLIPWEFGNYQKIKFKVDSSQIRISFLTSNQLTNGSSAPLCHSYQGSELVTNEIEVFPPFGCNYIFVLYEDNDLRPNIGVFTAYAYKRSGFKYNFELLTYNWMANGYYSGALSENNFTSLYNLVSTVIPLNGITAFIPHYTSNDLSPNWRLFDNSGNEILSSGSAYYYGVQSEQFYTIPGDAAYLQIVYNVTYMTSLSVDFFTGNCKTFNLKTTGGVLGSNGHPATPVTDATVYYRNLISINYINVSDNTFINVQPTVGTPTIACYDLQKNFIGNSVNGVPINGTRYVKVVVASENDITNNIDFIVNVAYDGEKPGIAKNDKTSGLEFVSYDVKMPNAEISADRLWNNGYILLPPNYTSNGDPVKLAIFVHGTEGYVFDETNIAVYRQYMDFIANNGYAVIDCSSLTSHYKKTVHDCDFCVPLSIECFKKLYEYIIEAYNVETTGVYVFGKSSGGLNALWLCGETGINAKCVGLIAPAVDAITTARVMGFPKDLNVWGSQLGFDGEFTGGSLSSNTDKQIVIDNVDKLIGYNPIWLHTINMNFNDFTTYILQSPFSTSGYENNSSLVGLVNSASNLYNTPVRIWHAIDDTNVPIATSRFLHNMIKRAGGNSTLTEYPAGHGAHHAMDNDPNAPQVQYETKYGGTVTISKGFAELVDWMNLY